ncbi:uncharacterized protein Grl62b [Drosophila montana]|uniref:uncharacterized protein Grl62b n=1 Tax=Drosophila montana TaxID=40370 RepID=UPI00313EFAAF
MRTHTTVKGFCLCHLLCVWRVTARLGIYLGYYNVGYAPDGQFVWDEQLYVQIMSVANMIASLAYLWLSQCWIYDQLLFLLFVPLYIYFQRLRQHLTKLLNACAQIHGTLQRILGDRMCVPLWRECVLTLLLPVELLLLFGWQCHMYYSYQSCFMAGVAFIYHMQLLFLGNYLIWLASIYRALNVFLQHHMISSRVGILRNILREQVSIWSVHWHIIRYFALHLLSFVALIALRFSQLLLDWRPANVLNIDRLRLVHLLLLLIPFITLLISSYDLQKQRCQFYGNYLQLTDRLEYFKLKSWCLLRNQTLPMPFGLPILQPFARPQHKRDVISMLVSVTMVPCPWRNQMFFTVFQQFTGHTSTPKTPAVGHPGFIKVGCLVLLSLWLYLWQHTHMQINFYNSYTQGNFDINVTQTISQVYRWYMYDELE